MCLRHAGKEERTAGGWSYDVSMWEPVDEGPAVHTTPMPAGMLEEGSVACSGGPPPLPVLQQLPSPELPPR